MKKVLSGLGFNNFDIEIYDFLIKNGTSSPATIASKLKFARPTVYKSLYSLEDANLIDRNTESPKGLVFTAKHPRFLEYCIQKERSRVNSLLESYVYEFANYAKEYEGSNSSPYIETFLGVDGLKSFHKYVEREADQISLIRSSLDRQAKRLFNENDRHVTVRSSLGIPVRIISPYLESSKHTIENFKSFSNWEKIQIRFDMNSKLQLPVQIMIFNNKIAFTDYSNEISTTLIHNGSISRTLLMIFDIMWEDSNLVDIRNMIDEHD